MDSDEGGIASIFENRDAIDLDDVTNLMTSDEEDVEVAEESNAGGCNCVRMQSLKLHSIFKHTCSPSSPMESFMKTNPFQQNSPSSSM